MHVLSRAVRIAGVQTLAMRSFRSLALRRPQRHITPAIAQSCNASWISMSLPLPTLDCKPSYSSSRNVFETGSNSAVRRGDAVACRRQSLDRGPSVACCGWMWGFHRRIAPCPITQLCRYVFGKGNRPKTSRDVLCLQQDRGVF
jgi:hypothetical protein